ncbi:peptidoglycan-binding protein [Streptomyces fuscigenes]|uniref:peptidoglycan-binding protein n=1 Tax=Streptomyces fuscigenes TaxID=1528880 RepID=UPI001F30153C|nr:peptidoglycan-binding protein [Streptomyces fuscigenes]MCF3960597.1 LysM peptidoglycan-binding domain-containing protein [Streptomyces fuscigenes]
MKFIQREDWGAPATSPAAYLASAHGVKIHYLGAPYSSRAHGSCPAYVRGIRAEHLANTVENYVDIAYSAVVCEHGYVYEGRGAHKRTGANGNQDLNVRDYAVCALLGDSGLTKPPDAMLSGLRDAIEWLRQDGAAGSWIGGHRDGYATLCPGDPLYAWVEDGAPRPGGATEPAGGTYTVRAGDTLAAIARRLDVSWPDLASANGIRAPYTIHPGQALKIPAGGIGGTPPPFPGTGAFVLGRSNPAVTVLDGGLIRHGFTRHHDGNGYQPGPVFTTYTRDNVVDFQRSRPELAGDADGYPGPLTWQLLLS